jgi:hypothetical protein
MQIAHRFFIWTMALFVVVAAATLVYLGYAYYSLPMEERFFSPAHEFLKPGGIGGHGLGIVGSFFMLFGVFFYMARKRFRVLQRLGHLKYWLEFHIFLCTMGPLLVLFHTAFKFGGLVAISFWSMVAVFMSGIIGRFIYIQIPRTIEGRELSLAEVKDMKSKISTLLIDTYHIDDTTSISSIKAQLKSKGLTRSESKKVLDLVKHDVNLKKKLERLAAMQNLFKYWHVAHLPFAIVMLIIMIIHVAVTIVFGYRWIF